MSTLFSALTTWLLFTGSLLLVGGAFARAVVIRRAFGEGAERHHAECSAGGLTTVGAALLPIALAMAFARQLAEFRDPFAPLSEDVTLLLGTSWGSTWTAAAVCAGVAALLVPISKSGGKAWWGGIVLAVPALLYPSLAGHAAGTGALAPVTIAADVLHLGAVGVWIGGLTLVWWAERSWRRAGGDASLLPRLVPVFSSFAVVAVTVLVATGIVGSIVHLGGLAELFITRYGQLLLLKLALVAVVFALGALNWQKLTPRLAEDDGPDALARSAARELLFAHVVLVVTALLVRTSPMAH